MAQTKTARNTTARKTTGKSKTIGAKTVATTKKAVNKAGSATKKAGQATAKTMKASTKGPLIKDGSAKKVCNATSDAMSNPETIRITGVFFERLNIVNDDLNELMDDSADRIKNMGRIDN